MRSNWPNMCSNLLRYASYVKPLGYPLDILPVWKVYSKSSGGGGISNRIAYWWHIPTDIDPTRGSNWEYSGLSCDQNNCDFVRCLCTAVWPWWWTPVKCRTGCKDCERILFVFVSVYMVVKNLNTPKLELHGWRHYYTGGIGVLGSPSYICARTWA